MDIDGHLDSPFDDAVYSGLADPLLAKHGTGSPPQLSSARALPSSARSPLGRTPLSPPRPPAPPATPRQRPSRAAGTGQHTAVSPRQPPNAMQRESANSVPASWPPVEPELSQRLRTAARRPFPLRPQASPRAAAGK